MVLCNYSYRNFDEIYLNGSKGYNSSSSKYENTSLIVGSSIGTVLLLVFIIISSIYMYKKI